MSARLPSLLAACALLLGVLACARQIPVESANTSATEVPTLTPSRVPTLAKSAQSVGTVVPNVARTAKIVPAGLNVHDAPSLDAPVYSWLRAGDPVVILETRGNWVRIQDPPGWIWAGCTTANPDRLGCEAK